MSLDAGVLPYDPPLATLHFPGEVARWLRFTLAQILRSGFIRPFALLLLLEFCKIVANLAVYQFPTNRLQIFTT
ncbi:MAG: hypothetical protein D6742_14300 [Cyanobacteria bacterium J069]|nr:MAG: hypothetical protein D6742_14300 [Cyanobacteria bacterium J069]